MKTEIIAIRITRPNLPDVVRPYKDGMEVRIDYNTEDGNENWISIPIVDALRMAAKEIGTTIPGIIKPLFNRVVIKPIEADEILKNNISMPDDVENTRCQGLVMAVGDEVKHCKVDDIVLYGKNTGDNLYISGESYLIMSERDIDAII